MKLLIHANVRVTGAAERLAAFRDEVNRLLFDEYAEADIEERYGENELVYDFKVTGGIPFPPFVAASARYPDVRVAVEWVNVQRGVKGYAEIENGSLRQSHTENLDRDGKNLTSVSVEPDGRLGLALSFVAHSPNEITGYAITSERDALIRFVTIGERSAELYTSSGDEPWWEGKARIDFSGGTVEQSEISDPMEEALFLSLRKHAEEFAAEWLWFDSAPPEETAIERERFRLAGYVIAGANIKYERLKTLLDAEDRKVTTLPKELQQIADIVRQCLP